MKSHPVAKILAIALVVVAAPLLAAELPRCELSFPNLPGYETLACDLHMHTVFSDGEVWPTARVREAWREGLHALAITDHLEYQPKRDDVPTHHNRPFELAEPSAKSHNLLLIRGAEITRDTPPGHFNAVFIKDAKPLDTPEFLDAMRAANDQGAFVFWNHQAWKGEKLGAWLDVHQKLYDNKWLHGMEVCNGEHYYPAAHQWCLDKKLTMIGNSDIHEPDLRKQSLPSDHRTLTLVFAKQRSLSGLKQALQEGRTAVWCKNELIGREEWLRPMFEAAVQVASPHQRTARDVLFEVRNRCDVDARLVRVGKLGPAEITLPAKATTLVKITVPDPAKAYDLSYTATNWLIAPATGLPVALKVVAAP